MRGEFKVKKVKITGVGLPNIPWQDKPSDCFGPVWRHSENPVINRNPVRGVARIFNGAVVPYEGGFIGVFRAETINGRPYLHMGRSVDGIKWSIEEKRIEFKDEDGRPFDPRYAYDPRLVKVEDMYYIIWCTDFYGASLGIAKTRDFKSFIRLPNPFLPFNRNGVLFPRKINGKFVLLSRPSDGGHTPFGDIFVSDSPDMRYWGNHRHVMGKGGKGWWQALKIGGGPAPIETTEGWLMFYHGVTQTCNGYVYSMGAVILDRDEPSIIKYRSSNYVLTPEEWYEERGFVDNVIFPCATLQDANTGRIAIYYGAADTYVAVAYTTAEEIVNYVIDNHEDIGDDSGIGIM
jgi:beta-1,4-mannooligosaccharide/beta-1,4-mannosyl-N-acetylglucosamine phosphorylase